MKKVFLSFMIMSSSATMAMQESPYIEINGQNKPLLGHINQALMWDSSHLRLVDFARWHADKKSYEITAEGQPDLSEQDLADVSSGNYVLFRFIQWKKGDLLITKIYQQ